MKNNKKYVCPKCGAPLVVSYSYQTDIIRKVNPNTGKIYKTEKKEIGEIIDFSLYVICSECNYSYNNMPEFEDDTPDYIKELYWRI